MKKHILTIICIAISTITATSANLVNNSSFEQGYSYWNAWGGGIDASKAHSGNNALHSTGRGFCTLVANYGNRINVSPNTYYKFSGYIFRADNSGWAYIDMNDEAGELQLRSTEYGHWEYVSGIWNSGGNTSVQLRAVVERDWTNPGSGVTGDIWFDDIVFEPLQSESYNENEITLSTNAQYTSIENSNIAIELAIDTAKPYISKLTNKETNQNWLNSPREIPLLKKINNQNINWLFDKFSSSENHIQAIFKSNKFSLILHAELKENGPVHIWQELVNNSTATAKISTQDMQALDMIVRVPNVSTLWRFNRSRFNNGLDGNFTTGVLKQEIRNNFYQLCQIENSWLVSTGELPLAMLDCGGEGLYIGYDWNFGLIEIQTQSNLKNVRLKANLGLSAEEITCEANSKLSIPGVFIGLYKGNTDDGGNQLKNWFWTHHIPTSLRENENEPLIEIHYGAYSENDFLYYLNRYNLPQLGVGLIKMDYWWTVPATGAEANSGFDPVLETRWEPYAGKWPNGMTFGTLTKAKYAGIKNSLYMCDTYMGADISNRNAQLAQIDALAKRIENWKIDYWRSDFDLEKANSFASHTGLLFILDSLINRFNNFRYEHCSAGGSLKDFTTLRRMTFMTMEDSGGPLNHRMAFYSNSYMINPVQLKFDVGYDWTSAEDASNINANGESWAKYVLRSSMMGAMMACAVGRDMTNVEFNQAKIHWKLYNEKQREILRGGNVYHILPMPNGNNWDGMQFFNNALGKGSVFLFSHKVGGGADGTSKRIFLKGLDENTSYQVDFQDRTELSCHKTGKQLMSDGILVTGMTKHFDTEIIWLTTTSTDIEEIQAESINIIPNPIKTGEFATLTNADETTTWKIYDSVGRLINKGNGITLTAPAFAGTYIINTSKQNIKWVVIQ